MKMRFANGHNFFLLEYFEKPIAYMLFDGELPHLTPFIILSCVVFELFSTTWCCGTIQAVIDFLFLLKVSVVANQM